MTINNYNYLENVIRERLIKQFSYFSYFNQPGLIGSSKIDSWYENENAFRFSIQWSILNRKKQGAPCVQIEKLHSDLQYRNHGIATTVLKVIIESLKETKNPHVKIQLTAWTCSMGNPEKDRWHGAYTWSRLGFEFSKKNGFPQKEWIAQIRNWFRPIPRAQTPENFITHEFIERGLELLENCKHPWDIAALFIDNFPVGKFILSVCNSASYVGKLLPNQPKSPGMIQYAKRIEELKERHNV